MPLNPNDLQVSIVSNYGDTINCAVGTTIDFTILFSNVSLTDPIYNLGFTLTLPDGLSFISASESNMTNSINSSFSNIITFVNIKDLYPNELNYKITITLKVDENYRSTGSNIAFDTVFSNIGVLALGDSMPRGPLDSGNTIITSITTGSLTATEFVIIIIFPPTYVKGAGASPGDPASAPFNITMEITNNTLQSSTIDLNLALANGLSYEENLSATGTDASSFSTVTVTPVSVGQDYVNLTFDNAYLSAGSETNVTFNAAIWDNLTANGIVNSGSSITNNYNLTSSLSATSANSNVYENFSIAALMLMFTKNSTSTTTDVGLTNNFTINYQCTEYTDLSSVVITDIIPNGMSFIINGSSGNYQSLTENSDGTTTIVWNLGTILSSGTGSLTILTSTDSTYISGAYVNSTDKLTNTAQISSLDSTGTTILGESSVTLTIASPTISKSVLSYNYSDNSNKSYNVATVGDFIEFEIIYDGTNLTSVQKDVILYDYPPLNMDVSNSIASISTTGDFPNTAIISVTAYNGLKFDLGNLDPGTYFTITFKIPVSEEVSSSTGNNLAKAVLLDNNNLSTSIRDTTEVFFGTPNLTLLTDVTGNNCYSLNNNYHFTFTITNESSTNIPYITDGFNLEFSTNIPSILSITSYSVTTDSSVIYDSISLVDNLLSFLIRELPIEKTLTLNLYATVSIAPIMSKNYVTSSTLTAGTSQSSESSYSYNISDLTSTKTTSACSPTISKSYTSNNTKLGDNYLVTISVTIPSGIVAYNANITDTLLTSNSSNLNNLTLNNASSSYLISGTKLSVTLPTTINSSSGEITYTLNYYDKITTVNPINYEDIQVTTAKLNWSSIINTTNDLLKSTTATMTTVVPNLTITKSQKNITRNTTFQSADILGSLLETIEYKLAITNNGLSPAYNVIITDILPNSLTFITYSGASGTFNYPTNTLTFTIPMINVNSTSNIFIEAFIDNSNSNPIASNEASTVYKANSNLNTNFGSSNSNNVSIVKDMIEITKEQRNLSFSSDYTKGTVNCLKGQSVDYKVTVTNNYSETLTNVTLSDFFPSSLDLVSYSSTKGSITINNNTLSVSIGSLSPDESVILTYSTFLNSDYLGRILSYGTINYYISNGDYSFNKNSNNIYTLLSSTGRGLKFY